MKKIIVIPARLKSSRLPNKVLLDLDGKTVVQRVFEQCLKAKNIDEVYIATDHEDIRKSCNTFTNNVIMTSSSHESGTDRIAEAIKNIDCEVVLNIQGDEPFIDPELIENIANAFDKGNIDMVSAMHKISLTEELFNTNIVKVVLNKENKAIYFSRSPIPNHRDKWEEIKKSENITEGIYYRHLGVYGYSKKFLENFSSLEMGVLEKFEKLEQLRAIENGYEIKMVETDKSSLGIDTLEDYNKAKEFISLVEENCLSEYTTVQLAHRKNRS